MQVDVEEGWVRARAAEDRILVHSTSCTQLRSCDTAQPGMNAQHPDCRLLPDGSLHCPTRNARAANAEVAKQMQQQWQQKQERQLRAGADSRIVGRSMVRQQRRIVRRQANAKIRAHVKGIR